MPIENFTTYTEADPGDDITVIASRVTGTNLEDAPDSWLYDDKDADHFDEDFEHLLTVYLDAIEALAIPFHWMLSNMVANPYDIDAVHSGDYLGLCFIPELPTIYLNFRECYGGALAGDQVAISLDTPYYLKIKRDESVGVFGTLYCYIYSDASRETLIHTLQFALHEKEDFRYIFALVAHGSTAGVYSTSYTENLDLQEAVLHEKEISEGVAVGEVLIKQPHHLISEGVVVGEVLVKSLSRVISEGIAIGEVLESVWTHVKTLTDGIAIGEVVVKQVNRIISDGIAIGEEVFKMWVHPAIRSLSPLRIKDAVRQLLKEREL